MLRTYIKEQSISFIQYLCSLKKCFVPFLRVPGEGLADKMRLNMHRCTVNAGPHVVLGNKTPTLVL